MVRLLLLKSFGISFNLSIILIWEGPEQTQTIDNEQIPDLFSHHVGKLSNGDYLLLRWMRDALGGPTDARLEEVTADNQIVWEWNLYDFITPPIDVSDDWCHANSATVNIEKNAVYLSCRWLGLFKTTYNNPEEVVWDFTLPEDHGVHRATRISSPPLIEPL
jgi:hypothetical protein